MPHSRFALTLFLLALPVGLWTGQARADEPVVVTLIDMSVDGAAQREIAHDVGRAIRQDDKLRYRDPNESLNVGAEDQHVSNVRSGEGLLKSALNRLKVKEYEDAAEELLGAATNLTISFAHVVDQAVVSRAMALQGAALVLAGDDKGAHKAFVRAVEFRPKDQLHPELKEYGDKVIAAYDKARSEVLQRATITYEITTKPPHAEVWVNGTYFGLTPTFVKRNQGTQFIRINKQGFARVGKVLQMTEGKQVSVELERARRAPAFDSVRERLEEIFDGAIESNDLSEAQGLLNASRAVFLRVSGTREKMNIQLALANLSGRQVVNRLSREVSWMRRDKKVIDNLIIELFKAPELPIGIEGPEVRTETVLTKWWFWGLIGGAVAGSVTAYLLLRDTETAPPKYKPGTGGLIIKF